MATVLLERDGDVVTQRCKKCGSDRVECWFWGRNPIIDYMNELFGLNKPNPYKQRWACWNCELSYDSADMSNSGEWVASEY